MCADRSRLVDQPPPTPRQNPEDSVASGSVGSDILRRLVDQAADTLLIVSADGTIKYVNQSCQELLGYRPEELIGRPIEILVPSHLRSAHLHHREVFAAAPSRRAMGRLNGLTAATKDGRIVPVDIALSPIGDDTHGPMIAVAIRDATAQRAYIHELERLATTDPLTGALNRRSFENAFERESERCRRTGAQLYIMIIDIDRFKSINDTYGHAVGDLALKALVSSCLSTLRKTDVFARIGGEEFAVLTPAHDAPEITALAERLREAAASIRIPVTSGSFGFTVSVGISRTHLDDEGLRAALNRADQALYAAKSSGRNRVVLDAR